MPFYAVIQFQPDRARAEGVNVGLLLADGWGVRVGLRPARLDAARAVFGHRMPDAATVERMWAAFAARAERVPPREQDVAAFRAGGDGCFVLSRTRRRAGEPDDGERLARELVDEPADGASRRAEQQSRACPFCRGEPDPDPERVERGRSDVAAHRPGCVRGTWCRTCGGDARPVREACEAGGEVWRSGLCYACLDAYYRRLTRSRAAT